MEKIIYIIILILLENNNYDNVETIHPINTYDFIINKKIRLDSYYVPSDLEELDIRYSCKDKYLRHEAKIAFEKMSSDALKDNMHIIAVSAFRSYEYQKRLFESYKKDKGEYYALLCSAKEGHSEHQTGLAVDISNSTLDYDNFENTEEFKWMINNSYKYGFILRYPKAKFHITGFKYEPWHYRYVGINIAKYIYKNKLTLEEYKKD